MISATIESHYLGCLEYYALLLQHDSVSIDINEVFKKQTYRNRCYLLGANKVQSLIIPIRYSFGMLTKDVTIDYSQRWVKDHWGAFYSAYGKAPFYEFFAEDFHETWGKKHKFLVDLNMDFLRMLLKILQCRVNVTYYEVMQEDVQNDFRDLIIPKESYTTRKIYQPKSYTQLFGDIFEPNLSIIDLVMCEGPRSQEILTASFLRT